MPLNWHQLAPHKPLEPGNTMYVPRPNHGALALAERIRRRTAPIAVAGPMGSGKSTELAQAGKHLELYGWFPCHVRLDKIIDMRKASPETVLMATAGAAAATLEASDDSVLLPEALVTRLVKAGAYSPRRSVTLGASYRGAALDVAKLVLRHLRKTGRDVALLVDGLEKASPESTRAAVIAMLDLRDDAQLVIVVSPGLVTGPEEHTLLTSAHLFHLRAIDVLGDGVKAVQFFHEVVAGRLGHATLPHEFWDVATKAAMASSGVPRAYLQLLLDAAGYAVAQNRHVPEARDLEAAMADHTESMRRLLREGDVTALRAADGTDGLEIPIERRIRFLVHGLLLEYEVDGKQVVRPARLLAPMLTGSAAA